MLKIINQIWKMFGNRHTASIYPSLWDLSLEDWSVETLDVISSCVTFVSVCIHEDLPQAILSLSVFPTILYSSTFFSGHFNS